MTSILKRVAVVLGLVVAFLAFMSFPAFSKTDRAVAQTGEVRGALSPFEEDLSTYSPREAAEYWNDWGNEYGRSGPMTNMFVCFLNAVRIMPHEPAYHQNLATGLFMYRKDAKEFFGVNEEQVFSMALREYRKARILDPENYELAKDLAMVHYGIKPFRAEEALTEWNQVLVLAQKKPDANLDEIYVNLGRVNFLAARYAEAQKWLSKVKAPEFEEMRNVLWARVTDSAQLRHDVEVSN
ncbi:MAG TPA: hypothetical protein VGH19_04825 [Verrucomicrobiae bacterium]